MRRTMYLSYHSKNLSHGHSKLSTRTIIISPVEKWKHTWHGNYKESNGRMRRVTWTGGWPERDRSLIRVVPWHYPSESSSSLTKNDPREWRAGIGGDPRVISIRSLQSGIISQETGGVRWSSRSCGTSCPFALSSPIPVQLRERWIDMRGRWTPIRDTEVIVDNGIAPGRDILYNVEWNKWNVYTWNAIPRPELTTDAVIFFSRFNLLELWPGRFAWKWDVSFHEHLQRESLSSWQWEM